MGEDSSTQLVVRKAVTEGGLMIDLSLTPASEEAA